MLHCLNQHISFGGTQYFYEHLSDEIGLPMRFAIYLPPQAKAGIRVSTLFFLAGLTCTHETFAIKAGAQRVAAELGMILVMPDTSPRNTGIANETAEWDFGAGAGFYVNAAVEPWAKHYRMDHYIANELYQLVIDHFPVKEGAMGISGHSMGGHGALSLALKYPEKFRSVSAFAPLVSPIKSPWGQKTFKGYLGDSLDLWRQYDACELMAKSHKPFPAGILIDQGLNDVYLTEQLLPELFEEACKKAEQPLLLRRHEGYDHGYYFVSSFIEDHLRFHSQLLG